MSSSEQSPSPGPVQGGASTDDQRPASRTIDPEGEARIAARYPAPSRRRLVLPLAAALLIALSAWILWAGLYKATPGITGQLQGYEVVDDSHVKVTVVVHRPDTAVAGLCTVQAQSHSGEVVGEVKFPVAPGGTSDTTHQTTVKTYLRATTAVLTGCTKV